MRAAGVFLFLVASSAAGCSDKSGATRDAAPEAAAADAGDAGGPSDAGVLEETAMPASSGEDLTARMRHLLEAIAQNNPDLASDALFPREGYLSARDAPDPQKAWDKRVSTAFRRSVEKTHRRMKVMPSAKFVSFELGRSVVQLTPKRKDFKKPLWRVKHSKLTFSVDGKNRQIDVAEMTAWRGNWYVTKLR